jgi:hypothetical protein
MEFEFLRNVVVDTLALHQVSKLVPQARKHRVTPRA